MRKYVVRERDGGWWVTARSWVDDGPPGPWIDIRGPFSDRAGALAYVAEVQVRQIEAAADRAVA